MTTVKEDHEVDVCFWMAFCPSNAKVPGMKPYAEPHSHPNGAKRGAIFKHFGMKQPQVSAHQTQSLWEFLYSKGFRIKRCINMKTDKTLEAENYEVPEDQP